ncbi:helix-turn-helix domain-containing protein [Streptomyces sp. NPDC092296]|uniref:helix-turn-helix domain-containing protein n=1 Tax=Streptomyces sp. NPDC092296 TaxID=3366012 RepID=UPI003800338C
MSDGHQHISTGERIAAYARNGGVTLRALAARAGVSYSLLTKVTSGHRPASPALVAAVARALGVTVDLLEPQPHRDATTDPLMPLMAPIRATLDLYDLAPQEDVTPRPLPQLRVAVAHINALAQAAQYKPMAGALPGLLTELHAAAHTFNGHDQQQAWGLLSEAYRCGHSVGIAIGLNGLSTTALNRMDWAAQRAGDRAPGLRAAREYLRVTAYLRTGDLEACQRLQDSGRYFLEGTDPNTPGALVARGQLHLGSAVVAARAGDKALMEHHLNEAARIAARTGEQNDFSVHFGPTNVSVHRVMTLVEVGEHAQAVAASKSVRFPSDWAPTRIGHHHIDLARSYRWLARPETALYHLDQAYAAAPQQASRHPLVRETVTALARTSHRHSDALSVWITRTGV